MNYNGTDGTDPSIIAQHILTLRFGDAEQPFSSPLEGAGGPLLHTITYVFSSGKSLFGVRRFMSGEQEGAWYVF